MPTKQSIDLAYDAALEVIHQVGRAKGKHFDRLVEAAAKRSMVIETFMASSTGSICFLPDLENVKEMYITPMWEGEWGLEVTDMNDERHWESEDVVPELPTLMTFDEDKNEAIVVDEIIKLMDHMLEFCKTIK